MARRPPTAEEALRYEPCWQEDEIEQVLATLGRLEKRKSDNLVVQRRHERKPYVAPVLVALHRKGRNGRSRSLLTVISRDLSRSGLGLIAPLFFEPDDSDESVTMLRGANVFREGAVLDLGLRKLSGDLLWLFGTVLHVCTVQHDFLDVGIRFNGRRNLALDFDFI